MRSLHVSVDEMNSGYDMSVNVNSWNKILIEVRLTKFENLKKIKKVYNYKIHLYSCRKTTTSFQGFIIFSCKINVWGNCSIFKGYFSQ
jgi:hypothetical protein